VLAVTLAVGGLAACSGSAGPLQYVFVGPSPFQGLPAHLTFRNFMAGPGRPHPPKNQTVSLAC
jgi:hypothetical protein